MHFEVFVSYLMVFYGELTASYINDLAKYVCHSASGCLIRYNALSNSISIKRNRPQGTSTSMVDLSDTS